MNSPNRRSVIKGLTALSLSSIITKDIFGSPSNANGKKRVHVNVVLHGLFVINLKSDHIELLTPYVAEHIYKVGSWDWPQTEDLLPGRHYRLSGVAPSDRAPALDQDCSIVLSQQKAGFNVRPENSHFVVELPLPQEIRFLRCLRGHDLFTGPSKDLIHANGISLCPVLLFESEDGENLGVRGSTWKPFIDDQTGSVNLHFWAEPPKDLDPMHAARAYSKLMDLIPPLQFSIAVDAKPPLDRATGVRGLPAIQELGWSEWASPGEGSYPTNCSTLVITP